MTEIWKNESRASYRVVPLWLVKSDGTSAATNESGATFNFSLGGAYYGSGGSLSAVSAPMGLYVAAFSASKLSRTGAGMVMYSSGTAIPAATPFQVRENHEFVSTGSQLQGGASLSNLTLGSGETSNSTALRGAFIVVEHADGTREGRFISVYTGSGNHVLLDYPLSQSPASGLSYTMYPQTPNMWSQLTGSSSATILGVTRLDSSVTLKAGTHSGATVQGLSNYANISNVTLHAGTHSNVTIQGVTKLNSSVTLNASVHSGATVDGLLNYGSGGSTAQAIAAEVWAYSGRTLNGTSDATINYVLNVRNLDSRVTLHPGTHSSVTISGIQSNVSLYAGTHSGVTIQGVSRLNSNVTLNAGTHSAATIAGLVTYASGGSTSEEIAASVWAYSTRTIHGAASAVSSGADIAAEVWAYSGRTLTGTSDATINFVAVVKEMSPAAARSVASSILSTNVGNDRLVQEYLWPLRNKVIVGSSLMTVYGPDDTTSAWSASVTTAADPLSGFDPAG